MTVGNYRRGRGCIGKPQLPYCVPSRPDGFETSIDLLATLLRWRTRIPARSMVTRILSLPGYLLEHRPRFRNVISIGDPRRISTGDPAARLSPTTRLPTDWWSWAAYPRHHPLLPPLRLASSAPSPTLAMMVFRLLPLMARASPEGGPPWEQRRHTTRGILPPAETTERVCWGAD